MSSTAQETETTAGSTGLDGGWRVVLFNCECHSFDEVERQLIKAVRCSLAQARAWSWEVHSKGSAVVYKGPQERCEAVAGVLEDIKLAVKVSQ
ncbi:MAG: ATP-dependent Clp protease adaptor ClpS [Elusimicrobia bacterium]|nr:ATP-dependent Clp protease adaptor ClpS [Elusimicrobiota bacterium]